jgi:hypothetical protein
MTPCSNNWPRPDLKIYRGQTVSCYFCSSCGFPLHRPNLRVNLPYFSQAPEFWYRWLFEPQSRHSVPRQKSQDAFVVTHLDDFGHAQTGSVRMSRIQQEVF